MFIRIKKRVFRLIKEKRALKNHTIDWHQLSKLIDNSPCNDIHRYSSGEIKKVIKKKAYMWFEDEPNIIAVRNTDYNHQVTNNYDDRITLSFKKNHKDYFFCWPCTTDPGVYYMKNLINKKGAAILAPGRYVDSYRLGLHQGKYLALIQAKGKVNVYRDNNFDDKYDMLNKECGYFGINIHKPENNSCNVDKNSAGCVVFKNSDDFDLFINILLYFKNRKRNSFTFTLVESIDF